MFGVCSEQPLLFVGKQQTPDSSDRVQKLCFLVRLLAGDSHLFCKVLFAV